MTIEVEGPDGAIIEFPDGTPPETMKAALAKHYGEATPAPQLPGNVVSRALQSVADPLNKFSSERQVPRLASRQNMQGPAKDPFLAIEDFPDAAARLPAAIGGGVAQFGADLTSHPLRTIGNVAESIASSPGRAIRSFAQTGPDAARGDLRAVARDLGDTALAGTEFASLFIPAAGRIKASPGEIARAEFAKQPAATSRAVARLTEADPGLAEAARRAARLQAEGIPVNTADLANRNAQSRLKGAARRDGPAQDIAQNAFDPRQADQAARLTGDIERSFGVQGDFLARRDAISSEKRLQSAPLYARAHATPTSLTPQLEELLARPPIQQALREADDLAAIDGVRLQPGNNTLRLHYARQAIDDQIDEFRNPVTGKVEGMRGGKLSNLRRDFNAQLREGNPAFRQADDIFSGGSRSEEAMNRGLQAAKMTTERDVRDLMNKAIRDGDQELFELGFAQGLVERIGKSGSDMANGTLKLLSPENQKIVTTVLGPDRGEALLNRIRVENLMARTRQRISPNVGSDTAENVQQTASQAVAMIAELARGNGVGVAARGAQAFGAKKLAAKLIEEQRSVDEQLLRLATEDPDELIRLINIANAPRQSQLIQIPFREIAGRAATAGAAQQPNQ